MHRPWELIYAKLMVTLILSGARRNPTSALLISTAKPLHLECDQCAPALTLGPHPYLPDAHRTTSPGRPSLARIYVVHCGLSGTSRGGKLPCHGLGVLPSSATSPWTVKAPPHKWRYCTLAQQHDLSTSSSSSPSSSGTTARAKAEAILRELQDTFFPSAAFCAWLTIVIKLIPLSYAVEARRFRPGLDYTLATSDEGESRLDIVLGLTPQPKKTDEENCIRYGYSLDLAAHLNCLLLVLRDEGVRLFVKYVSATAPGSRWDICSDFEVGMVELISKLVFAPNCSRPLS